MKTSGRPKSHNIVNVSNVNFNGKRNQFVNESMTLAAQNHKPSTKFGKEGTRKKSTGYKTGGGF